ncbi:protein BOLA4, chloroplastic/mitochondrial-like [Aristolochia californica]|uniref:protein BOLA4, chloroplastic/mitochondrial-like n=1 Tax=Aristolochia californica TaxID=171875 RepID=UPI0035E2F11B
MAKTTLLLMRPYVFTSASFIRRAFYSSRLVSTSVTSPRIFENISITTSKKLQNHGFPCHASKFHGRSGRKFSTRATDVSDSGSIDSPMMQSMEQKIKEQLNADKVIVKDAYGDGRHVSIDVVSTAFEGQSAVNRQRMVYKAIWEELQNTVHAVDQMTTRTPAEAAAAGNR